MSPALTAAAAENPAACFRFCPSTCTLLAGILDNAVSPPATPTSRAATSEPSTADKLGAVLSIRDCTSCTSWRRSSSICIWRSHAARVSLSVASGSGAPGVVAAVTETTITAAEGKTASRSTRVTSISLPMARTTRA